MTNDELQKKISEIIDGSVDDWATRDRRGRIQVHVSTIADILVKAGLKFDASISHTATFDMLQQDRINELEKRIAEAEHRAEVAERALERACEDLNATLSLLIGLAESVDGLSIENYSPEECEPKAYIYRTEIALTEEQGDGEKNI